MDKEFIPQEQALALKELGFNEPCFGFYIGDIIRLTLYTDCGWKNSTIPYDTQEELLTAPLYQQVFRWFREKYGYFTSPTESDDDISKKYDWLISKNLGESKMFIQFIGYRDSYEEAELECLKKLIEIVKNAKK